MCKVYIASPFFIKEEKTTVKMIEDKLTYHKFSHYSPARDGKGIVPDLPNQEKLKLLPKIFEDNVSNIDSCQLMIANIDGLRVGSDTCKFYQYEWSSNFSESEKGLSRSLIDTGTIFEVGYAHAKGIPIVTYSSQNFGVNIMLSQSIQGHCKNETELDLFLFELTKNRCQSTSDVSLVKKKVLNCMNVLSKLTTNQ